MDRSRKAVRSLNIESEACVALAALCCKLRTPNRACKVTLARDLVILTENPLIGPARSNLAKRSYQEILSCENPPKIPCTGPSKDAPKQSYARTPFKRSSRGITCYPFKMPFIFPEGVFTLRVCCGKSHSWVRSRVGTQGATCEHKVVFNTLVSHEIGFVLVRALSLWRRVNVTHDIIFDDRDNSLSLGGGARSAMFFSGSLAPSTF